MALDACYLTFLTNELNSKLTECRVDKVFQPSRDEIVLNLRGMGRYKLVISCSPHSPRITINSAELDNPPVPPMFCMVLRKHLTGARVERIYMPCLERAVFLDFEAKNEFFEPVKRTLVAELTGRSANIILLDENQKILDAVKKMDLSDSKTRQIIPSVKYTPLVSPEGKKPITNADKNDVEQIAFAQGELFRLIMDRFHGISPIVARELVLDLDSKPHAQRLSILWDRVLSLQQRIENCDPAPTLIQQLSDGRLIDFSFMPIYQYGPSCKQVKFDTAAKLIDAFYTESASKQRLMQKSKDLSQLINRLSARTLRTMNVRKRELEMSGDAEKYRIYGEIINANLYRMKIGMPKLEAENFYDNCKPITIPLRVDKSPTANAQIYFKKYTKAKNSVNILKQLIEKDSAELKYLESVGYALENCSNLAQVDDIRAELVTQKYISGSKREQKQKISSKPRKFISPSGFEILIGRNNLQNDLVTIKLSRKNDIWLHTKNVHSCHTLIVSAGKAVDDDTILYAASLCAYYSKAKNDLKVEVDYCPCSNVKKPNGAKPGMVIYNNYKTVVVKPHKPDENDE